MARYRARYRVEGLHRQERGRSQPAQARDRRLCMMHGPLPDQPETSSAVANNVFVAALERALGFCNYIIVILAGIALVAASAILSYSVLSRALFHSPNYWQDEAPGFLPVAAPFMTPAYVQGQ